MNAEKEKHSLLKKINEGKIDFSPSEELVLKDLIDHGLIIDASSSMGRGYKLSIKGEDFFSNHVFPKIHRVKRNNKVLNWIRDNTWKFLLFVGGTIVLSLLSFLIKKLTYQITCK